MNSALTNIIAFSLINYCIHKLKGKSGMNNGIRTFIAIIAFAALFGFEVN